MGHLSELSLQPCLGDDTLQAVSDFDQLRVRELVTSRVGEFSVLPIGRVDEFVRLSVALLAVIVFFVVIILIRTIPVIVISDSKFRADDLVALLN